MKTPSSRSSVRNYQATDLPTDGPEHLDLAELVELAREKGLIRHFRMLPESVEIETTDGDVAHLEPEALEGYLRCLIQKG